MRLSTTIDLFFPGEPVVRSPSLWDRIKHALGGPDPAPERTRHALEASALVSDLREALRRLGIDDAISLVVDGQVVWSDPRGRPDDFGDLVLALSEQAPVFGGGFRSLRLAVEHREAGLRHVIEISCVSEHAEGEPSATVRVASRIVDLEPQPGEDAEGYRRRIAPLAGDAVLLDAHKRQFESFAARLADALRAAFPTATVEEREPEATVVRPGPMAAPAPVEPTEPGYDPYARHYPNPFEGVLSGLLVGSLLTSAFRPPGLMIVDPSGAPISSAEDLDAHTLSPGAYEPGAPDLGGAPATPGGQESWEDEADAARDPDSAYWGDDTSEFGDDWL